MTTTTTNAKKPKRRSASQNAVVQRGLSSRTTAKNSCIKIATCPFCKRELLFDTLLRRIVGLRGRAESRPCQHLVAACFEEKITTRVHGKEMMRDSKLAWFAGKTREISAYGRPVADFLAGRLQTRLVRELDLESGCEVETIRKLLPPVQLGAGEVDCTVKVAANLIFSRDRKAFLDRFEEAFPGDLDDFEEVKKRKK